jgi:hypothetical protein
LELDADFEEVLGVFGFQRNGTYQFSFGIGVRNHDAGVKTLWVFVG